jgi:hypothetical protein
MYWGRLIRILRRDALGPSGTLFKIFIRCIPNAILQPLLENLSFRQMLTSLYDPGIVNINIPLHQEDVCSTLLLPYTADTAYSQFASMS